MPSRRMRLVWWLFLQLRMGIDSVYLYIRWCPRAETDGYSYEFAADNTMTVVFPLSKIRLNKNNIVYSDEDTLCVRIQEKLVRSF